MTSMWSRFVLSLCLVILGQIDFANSARPALHMMSKIRDTDMVMTAETTCNPFKLVEELGQVDGFFRGSCILALITAVISLIGLCLCQKSTATIGAGAGALGAAASLLMPGIVGKLSSDIYAEHCPEANRRQNNWGPKVSNPHKK